MKIDYELLVHEPKLLGKSWKLNWSYYGNYISVDGLKVFENPDFDLAKATPNDIIEFVFNEMSEKYYGTTVDGEKYEVAVWQ